MSSGVLSLANVSWKVRVPSSARASASAAVAVRMRNMETRQLGALAPVLFLKKKEVGPGTCVPASLSFFPSAARGERPALALDACLGLGQKLLEDGQRAALCHRGPGCGRVRVRVAG